MSEIAILYEHPEWFKPLFAELDRRGVSYEKLDATRLKLDPAADEGSRTLAFNRMSPSAHLRGHGNAIFATLQYLSYLKEWGIPTVNGYDAFRLEISKAAQLSLLRRLGLLYPRALVINNPRLALEAAEEIGYPLLLKPNVGGSGAGIRSFEDAGNLETAVNAGEIDLGIDGTALVQEKLTPRGGHIVRVEVLNGEFLYAIKIFPKGEAGFNLCPADICQETGGAADLCPAEAAPKLGLRIEAYRPPDRVIRDALAIARTGHLDLGGVEYLVNSEDDEVYFYDINALSNFVSDAPTVVGFDPFLNLVDFLEARIGAQAAAWNRA